MEVFHIAAVAGKSDASYPVDVTVHKIPMYHKGQMRCDGFNDFWDVCKAASRQGRAVVIHCNQSFHRGPLALAAVMKRAGYSSERAFSTIAARRHIYTGHTLPFAEWPEEEKQSFHSPDFLECHLWVNKLEPDTAYLDAKEIDSVVASVNAATSWTTQTEWRCNGCNTPDKKMRECWECGAWECKACSFWCTTCRKGYHQYTICGHCHAQGIYLKRSGKIWRCSLCEQARR